MSVFFFLFILFYFILFYFYFASYDVDTTLPPGTYLHTYHFFMYVIPYPDRGWLRWMNSPRAS